MYDPSRAAYITYDDLRCLVSKGVDFVVQDNNGTDVTHPTLLQLALDPQTRSFPLLTPCFLKDLIRLYETSANDAIALYLDHCMALFAANRSRLDHTYGATSASAPGGVIHPPGAGVAIEGGGQPGGEPPLGGGAPRSEPRRD